MSLENLSPGIEIPKLKALTNSEVHKIQSFVLKYNLIPLLIVLSLAGVGLSAYLFYQYYTTSQFVRSISTKPVLNKEEIKGLLSEIGKIAKLPQGEEPSVATVTDISKLRGMPFFSGSKNGDRLLVYNYAQKLVLYDPVEKKIVNIAPLTGSINPAGGTTQTTAPAAPQAQARIVLRNGTLVTGLASKVETEIKKTFPQANIVNKDNSSKSNYDKTVVVVLNDIAKDASINLAKALNITVSDLPQGEIKPPDADLLVIIGKDKI